MVETAYIAAETIRRTLEQLRQRGLLAAAPMQRPLSRKLMDIDRNLRLKLLVAANAALKRALERAGARVVTRARVASAGVIRDSIKNIETWRIPAHLGLQMVAAMGLNEQMILESEFRDLKEQWDTWVATGQDQALRTAAKIAGMDVTRAYAQVGGRFANDRAAGWALLEKSLKDRTNVLLADSTAVATANVIDNTLVTPGIIRAAVSVAGGFDSASSSSGLGVELQPVDSTDVMGGIGTGDTITSMLSDAGVSSGGYQWVHGMSNLAFEPHLELDGVVFQNFDDDVLLNPGDWPAPYLMPGDHDGCQCDFTVLWDESSE